MSHLVPTQITDKNGVITIRHKKAEGISTRPSPSIPQVSVLTPSTLHDDPMTTDQAIDLVFPEGVESYYDDTTELRAAIELLNEHAPDSLPAAADLLSQGTDKGHEDVRARMRGILSSIILSIKRLRDDEPDRLLKDIAYDLQRASPENLRQYWNCGNVMEESGFTDDAGVPGRLDNIVRQEFRNNLPTLDPSKATDVYWRGVTAFTIADVLPPRKNPDLTNREDKALAREFYRNTKQFITYAGKHKDIGLVIRTAKERQTVVVSEIKDIIAQGNVAPSIRDGAL